MNDDRDKDVGSDMETPNSPRGRRSKPMRGTSLQVKTGEIHATSEKAIPQYRAIVKAGGSHWTARKPWEARLDRESTIIAYRQSLPPEESLANLEKQGIRHMVKVLKDPNASETAQTATAIAAVRLNREFGTEEKEVFQYSACVKEAMERLKSTRGAMRAIVEGRASAEDLLRRLEDALAFVSEWYEHVKQSEAAGIEKFSVGSW